MPVSFASMFGGVCTLIGSSTNILVSAIAVGYGLPAISMFDFTKMGIVFFGVGILYMAIFGARMIPERSTGADLADKYRMDNYLTDIVLQGNAKSVGMRVADSPLVRELEIDVLEVIRNGQRLLVPVSDIALKENDLLRVRCDLQQLQKLKERMGIQMKSDCQLHEKDFSCENLTLTEVVVAPNSSLIGKTIKSSYFRNVFRSTALALRHGGQLYNTGFADTPLRAGDAMHVSPRPFLMAIAFAASASFMTPVGYQTNTMIYGVGQYKFIDFIKVGTPLTLLFWVLATLLIPVFFPF